MNRREDVKRKIAQSDFLEDQLPQTRRSQFKDILKINFRTFLIMGLILLGASMLLLVRVGLTYHYNDAVNVAFKEGRIPVEDKDSLLEMIFLISEASNVILYIPIFVVLAGIMRLIREMCYTEGVIFSYDFKQGIKENWGRFMGIAIILGVTQFVIAFLFAFFGIKFITAIPFAITVLLVVPTLIGATYFFSTYENSFGRGLWNSFLIHIRASWRSLVLTIVLIAPVILMELFLNIIFVKILSYVVLLVLALPIHVLAGYEMYLHVYDEHVNVYHFKEAMRKGLYISEEEKQNIKRKLEESKGGQNEK